MKKCMLRERLGHYLVQKAWLEPSHDTEGLVLNRSVIHNEDGLIGK